MQVTVEIPDGPLTEEVSSWQDGQSYTFTVTQNSTGAFTADTAMATPAEEVAEPVEEATPAENPAVAAVIAKGKTGAVAAKKVVA